eukprot:5591672-Amphidinium_carterae.1
MQERIIGSHPVVERFELCQFSGGGVTALDVSKGGGSVNEVTSVFVSTPSWDEERGQQEVRRLGRPDTDAHTSLQSLERLVNVATSLKSLCGCVCSGVGRDVSPGSQQCCRMSMKGAPSSTEASPPRIA